MGQWDYSSGLFHHSLALWISGWLPESGQVLQSCRWHSYLSSPPVGRLTNLPPGICSTLPQQLRPLMPNLHSQRHLPLNHRFCYQRELLISAHEPQQSRPPGATATASEKPFHYPLPAPRLTVCCCCCCWSSMGQHGLLLTLERTCLMSGSPGCIHDQILASVAVGTAGRPHFSVLQASLTP